ncbi:GNAT family N-acetyltransferase [Metabacillus sp. JX24]|uniref:GNAT family N-acetyltransferase n=1 Tax=Metabacillus sp. JX24 TaxID=3240759 RepID=UPI003510B22E
MMLKEYKDRRTYIEKSEPLLMKQEAENNLALGLLSVFKKTVPASDVYTALMETEGAPAAALLMTPPHNLILTYNNELISETLIAEMVRQLISAGVSVPGAVGERYWTERFAKEWAEQAGNRADIVMEQKIYQLHEVQPVSVSEGTFQKAKLEHLPLLTEWMADFMTFTNEPPITTLQAAERMKKFLAEDSIYIWSVDGIPVSMAKKSRSTQNGITVSLVYTPEKFRGRGYASSCVSALSSELLKNYSFCTLYTDLSNPTSNSIYQKIGYKPIQDSVMISFSNQGAV